jgi:antitoxin component HigA of HigAB toxin-antitoxin module
MERKGLSGIDRVPIFKTTARLSEVMTKPRRLNLAMIRRLPERLAMTKP